MALARAGGVRPILAPLLLAAALVPQRVAWAEPVAGGPPAAGVPVTFVADDARFVQRVLVGGQACATPCTLVLPPGPARLFVGSARLGAYHEVIVVPPTPATVRLRPGPGAAGAAALLGISIGIPLIGSALAILPTGYPDTLGGQRLPLTLALAAFGSAAILGGVIGAIVAGRPAEVVPGNADAGQARATGVRLAGVGFAPRSDGAVAGLAFAFW